MDEVEPRKKYPRIASPSRGISHDVPWRAPRRQHVDGPQHYHSMANTIINPARDPNTLSNYNNWLTAHTTANLDIAFEKQTLSGNVVLTLKSITNAETKEIILDTSHLDISEISVNGKSATWELLPRLEPYGSALKISLESGVPADQTVEVLIYISTTESCTALQWLTPTQTSNKKQPYMFSQCQAILARLRLSLSRFS